MGTQAIVSIVEDSITKIKAICGCNGYYAEKLAEIVRSDNLTTAAEVYQAAHEVHFGCRDCLVVLDSETFLFAGANPDSLFSLHPLYRETFGDPKFNPRWERGTACHVIVVKRTTGMDEAEIDEVSSCK